MRATHLIRCRQRALRAGLDRDERPHVVLSEPINIPVPGRTFDDVLGAAAGTQVDDTGVSFTGVTSLENTYVVDD